MRYNYGRFVEWGALRVEGLHKELGTKGGVMHCWRLWGFYRNTNSTRLVSIVNRRVVAAAKNFVPLCLIQAFTCSGSSRKIVIYTIKVEVTKNSTPCPHIYDSSYWIWHRFRALHHFEYLPPNFAAEHKHLRSRFHFLLHDEYPHRHHRNPINPQI